jgi:hypothetical protein
VELGAPLFKSVHKPLFRSCAPKSNPEGPASTEEPSVERWFTAGEEVTSSNWCGGGGVRPPGVIRRASFTGIYFLF